METAENLQQFVFDVEDFTTSGLDSARFARGLIWAIFHLYFIVGVLFLHAPKRTFVFGFVFCVIVENRFLFFRGWLQGCVLTLSRVFLLCVPVGNSLGRRSADTWGGKC